MLVLRQIIIKFCRHVVITFTHEAVRDWEVRFAPLLTGQLRARRHGQAGISWHVDETSVKVQGKWCYLYRALDRDGNLVDSMPPRMTFQKVE